MQEQPGPAPGDWFVLRGSQEQGRGGRAGSGWLSLRGPKSPNPRKPALPRHPGPDLAQSAVPGKGEIFQANKLPAFLSPS